MHLVAEDENVRDHLVEVMSAEDDLACRGEDKVGGAGRAVLVVADDHDVPLLTHRSAPRGTTVNDQCWIGPDDGLNGLDCLTGGAT